jgi:hypothetical protein
MRIGRVMAWWLNRGRQRPLYVSDAPYFNGKNVVATKLEYLSPVGKVELAYACDATVRRLTGNAVRPCLLQGLHSNLRRDGVMAE